MGLICFFIVWWVLIQIIAEYKSPSQKIKDADNDPNYYFKSGNHPNGYYSVAERYGKKR